MTSGRLIDLGLESAEGLIQSLDNGCENSDLVWMGRSPGIPLLLQITISNQPDPTVITNLRPL